METGSVLGSSYAGPSFPLAGKLIEWKLGLPLGGGEGEEDSSHSLGN